MKQPGLYLCHEKIHGLNSHSGVIPLSIKQLFAPQTGTFNKNAMSAIFRLNLIRSMVFQKLMLHDPDLEKYYKNDHYDNIKDILAKYNLDLVHGANNVVGWFKDLIVQSYFEMMMDYDNSNYYPNDIDASDVYVHYDILINTMIKIGMLKPNDSANRDMTFQDFETVLKNPDSMVEKKSSYICPYCKTQNVIETVQYIICTDCGFVKDYHNWNHKTPDFEHLSGMDEEMEKLENEFGYHTIHGLPLKEEKKKNTTRLGQVIEQIVK